MALVTYPLNNIEYSAEDAELFHVTRTSGVYANNSFDYGITGADNNIVIGTGIGWIKNSEFSGKVIAQKEAISLDMGLPDPVYPRIDAIIIQFDNNRNETNIVVKKGTAASNPVAPSVVQNESVYELHLYHVRREAGSLYITPSNITDLRLNSSYCGLMADSVTYIDTTAIERQVADLIESLQNEISNVIGGSAYLLRDGSTNMTGNLPMDGHKVTELGTPTADGDAVPLGYANQNFAPAGYGFGENRPYIVVSTDAELEAALDEKLEAMISNGASQATMQLTVNCAAFGSYNGAGILHSTHADGYVEFNYYGLHGGLGATVVRKIKFADTWRPAEWVNPPMNVGVEYRTTERIGGKAVYKKNVNGVIQYRLDGETTWHNYSDAVGAAPAGLNAEDIQFVTSNDALNSAIATAYNSMENFTVKFKTIHVNASGISLSGGSWQFVINRSTADYGIVYGVNYNRGRGFVFRVLSGGTWGDWQDFYPSNFAPAGYKTKLWQNASRTSSFAPQTISVDLSGYDEVEVYYCLETEAEFNKHMISSICPVGESLFATFSFGSASATYSRGATTSTGGVTFSAGYQSGSISNSSLVPYRIFGIKGVK